MKQKKQKQKPFHHLLYEYKFYFVAIFGLVFLVSFSFLYFLNLVPTEIQVLQDEPTPQVSTPPATPIVTTQGNTPAVSPAPSAVGEEPRRIIISSIGVNAPIENPRTTNADVLDAALTKGAVHYPGSSLPGDGNTFLFGHSTGFRIVNNQAYKTFNHLKDLKEGDLIQVYGDTKEYRYRVFKVTLADADQALVVLGTARKMITVSTCNTFGEKQERYVAEADFVGAIPISSDQAQ